MAETNRKLMKAWLRHLERGLERSVRQRDVQAIRTALGIAKRRMKLQGTGGTNPVKSDAREEGYPITIFSDAIKEMERRRRERGED